jgi:hypothetical protein
VTPYLCTIPTSGKVPTETCIRVGSGAECYSYNNNYAIARGPNGLIAVAYTNEFFTSTIALYDNTRLVWNYTSERHNGCYNEMAIVVSNNYFIFQQEYSDQVVVIPAFSPESFLVVSKEYDYTAHLPDYQPHLSSNSRYWLNGQGYSNSIYGVASYDESVGAINFARFQTETTRAIIDDNDEFVWILSGNLARYTLPSLTFQDQVDIYSSSPRFLRASGTKLLFVDVKGIAIADTATGKVSYIHNVPSGVDESLWEQQLYYTDSWGAGYLTDSQIIMSFPYSDSESVIYIFSYSL